MKKRICRCQFWPQNLKFRTTGSPEQFENSLNKYINFHKISPKIFNAFGSALRVKKQFFQLLGRQSEVAASSGSNKKLIFFIDFEL